MKRLYIGLAVLALLLISGCLLSLAVRRMHAPMVTALEQAACASLEEDWEKAAALTGQVRAVWNGNKFRLSAAVSQQPIGQAEGLLSQLEIFLDARDNPHFAALCRELADLFTAMAEGQSLPWWGLL